MKVYTVIVPDLRMCIKEDNPGLKKISNKIIFCAWRGYLLWFDWQF